MQFLAKILKRLPWLVRHIKGLSADEAASQIYDLYKRQATQMDTGITQGIQSHARELSMGKLPDSCLLILSILDNYRKFLKNDMQLTERQRKDYGKFEYAPRKEPTTKLKL